MAKCKAPAGCYWRGNTLWGEAQVNGRKLRWSLGTSDPKLARQRQQAGKQRAIAEMIHGDAPRLVADVIEAWGPHFKAQNSPATFTRYMVSLGQLFPWLDGRKVSDINARLIGDIIAERQRSVSNATIRRDLGALSSIMNYATDRGWCAANPVRITIKEKREPIILPRDQDIELVIARGQESDRRPGAKAAGTWPQLIRAAWLTGARLNELIGAERAQVNHDRKELTVIGKGNKLRVIDLEPFGAYGFFASIPAYVACKLLFWHDHGEPYRNASSNFANNLIGSTVTFAEKAGISFQPFRFHDLRHKHAVDWLQSGRSIYDLQRRLGHTSVKTTEGYLQFVTGDQERVAKFGGRGA